MRRDATVSHAGPLGRVRATMVLVALALGGASCAHADDSPTRAPPETPVRIAFMPDVHVHDVHAAFEGDGFPGITMPGATRPATIRTMDAQLRSTRLFNENHAAFLAALDDAVARGVRLVALPGDFSDDGQPVHVRGLVRILDDYSARHGMRFFVVPGNHDPVRPLETPGGKSDYLGRDPRTGAIGPHAVFSHGGHPACAGGDPAAPPRPVTVHCTEDVRHMGYAGLTDALAGHGFMPRVQDRYFATPYSRYRYADYTLAQARVQAQWPNRRSRVCMDGVPTRAAICREVTDTSYVVEPVDGLWLIGLDANVYVPDGAAAVAFTGSGSQGWNAMLRHKPHVVDWLAEVVAEGASLGKQVIAFSHYPMAEFYNGASDDIAALMGGDGMQLGRRPTDATTHALAQTGLRVHVGGHVHVNDIAVRGGDGLRAFFNVQAASIAAHVPAYTLMTLDGTPQIGIETIVLDDVPGFDAFFDLYRAEHAVMAEPRWDLEILDARTYRDYTRRYLRQLVQRRLLGDWPCAMQALARSPLTGADLLTLSQWPGPPPTGPRPSADARLNVLHAVGACASQETPRVVHVDGAADTRRLHRTLADAEARAEALARTHGLRLEALAHWSILDFVVDVVGVANAGDLAFEDIPHDRAAHYGLLARALRTGAPDGDAVAGNRTAARANDVGAALGSQLGAALALLETLADGAPTRRVVLDLAADRLIDVSDEDAARHPLLDARPERFQPTPLEPVMSR